jgi:hypothetical protein
MCPELDISESGFHANFTRSSIASLSRASRDCPQCLCAVASTCKGWPAAHSSASGIGRTRRPASEEAGARGAVSAAHHPANAAGPWRSAHAIAARAQQARVARGKRLVWYASGPFFSAGKSSALDRRMTTPRDVANTLRYVLENHRKQASETLSWSWKDPSRRAWTSRSARLRRGCCE